MKVLFVVPPFGGIKKEGKTEQKQGFLPPIGIALLATILDQDGHEVKVLDMQVQNLPEQKLIDFIEDYQPQVVCFSILAATSLVAAELVALIKQHIPNVIIVCGGLHASMFPEETLKANPTINYLVSGEGEYTFKELLYALEQKLDVSHIKGLYYKKDEEIISTGIRPFEKDLNKFPIPSRKFFTMSHYVPLPSQYHRFPVGNMITSRGCTYSLCTFCFESSPFVREKGFRRISVQRAIEEITYLINDYHVKEIAFWDDEFLMDHEWVDVFCDEIIRQKIDILWSCFGKVNFCSLPLLKKMAQSGCKNIFMGLESGNQEILNFTKKGQTLDMMRNAVRWAHEAGIEVRGSFILGLPKETPEIAQSTVDFAIELDLDYAQFLLNTPFPGTEMHEVCKSGKYGAFDENAGFEKYTEHTALFLPSGYKNKEELLSIQKEAYKHFYFRPKYFLRKVKNVRSKEDVFRYFRGFHFLLKTRVLKNSEF